MVHKLFAGDRLVLDRAVFTVIQVEFYRLLQAVPSAHRIPRGVLRKRNGNGFSAESRMRVRSQNGKSNMLPLQGSLKALSKLASRCGNSVLCIPQMFNMLFQHHALFTNHATCRDAAVFAVAISAGFLAHLDPFGNLHWDSMNAVQGLAWAGPIIAVGNSLPWPCIQHMQVPKHVT